MVNLENAGFFSRRPCSRCTGFTVTLSIARHSLQAAGLVHGVGGVQLWGDRALGVRVNWEAGRL